MTTTFLHDTSSQEDLQVFAASVAQHRLWFLYQLEQEKITLLHTVPALAQSWLANIPSGISLRSLRWVFFAGEPLTDVLVQRWREAFPEAGGIVNLYGPTETSLAKCFYIPGHELARGVQPVGRPIPACAARIPPCLQNAAPSGRRVQDFDKLLTIDPRLERMFPPVEALYNDYIGVFNWVVLRHETGVYPGKITFYWPSEEPFGEKIWLPVIEAKASEEIEHHIVSGTHMSCVTEHAQDLATCLGSCLSRVQEETVNHKVGATNENALVKL
jgi:acyl-CoA synthetase (AMP-forming)/AMP-acid ligase II